MMTARGRRHNQDWDPMRDDFDNSSYDPQHPDDTSGSYVNLDHCRLYITNIPLGLNDEGLSSAFSRFGTLTEVYIHKDPEKRYGLVAFETPGEAKLAMMKLNRTDPLKLNINIAHKSKRKAQKPYAGGNSSGPRDSDNRSYREDGSSHSNLRRQDLMANGDNMEDLVDDDPILGGSLEPYANMELEEIRMEQLKLREAQLMCRKRMLLFKQADKKSSSSSRCVLPDGRVIVRSVERAEAQDCDGSFGAGAGDASRALCVACGDRAESFCAGCRVTPYCSPACQRRDWGERHRKVCHNLKRQSGGVAASRLESEPELVIPPPAPLRRPRSPEPARDDGSDRAPPRRFGPPGGATSASTGNQGGRNAAPTCSQNRANQSFDSSRSHDSRNQSDNRSRLNRSAEGDGERSTAGSSNDRNHRNQTGRNQNDRYQSHGERPDSRNRGNGDNNRHPRQASGYNDKKPQNQDDEDWGPKAEPKPQETKPAFKPKSPAVQREEPQFEAKTPVPKSEVVKASTSVARPMASAADVAPVARKMVPQSWVVDLLPVGTSFVASVDAKAEDGDGSWLCVTCAEDYADVYQMLFDPLAEMCEAGEVYEPRPGDVFGYLDEEDGGWYRARCLAPARAALLDAGRRVSPAPGACRRLPAEAAHIPEFSCRLDSAALQLNTKVDCTIISKSNGAIKVSLVVQETNAQGTGVARRWVPEVEVPKVSSSTHTPAASASAPTPAASASAQATAASASAQAPAANASATPVASVPQVPRPPVANNSTVVLVDATEPARVFVRPSSRDQQAQFDDLMCEVALYGADENTPRLQELPTAGQLVVALFNDGLHYRALVQRVSSKHKRCLLEYVEFGNVEAVVLEDIRPCPPQFELAKRPTLTSMVTLQMTQKAFTDSAKAYLDKLKEDAPELTLSIISGESSGGSNTPVRLTVAGSGEDVARRLDQLSTPEWKRLLEQGGDVLQIEKIMFQQLLYVDPACEGGELQILDMSLLRDGLVTGHPRAAPHAQRAYKLTPQLEEYCNSALAKDPYLPRVEELCIALCPERKQWLRGVLLQQADGPGSRNAQVLFYDYGSVTLVPVTDIRKMMPEFAHGIPAAAGNFEIKDFPKNSTPEQIARAERHMQLSAAGTGVLRYTRCTKIEPGLYVIEAPELLRDMH